MEIEVKTKQKQYTVMLERGLLQKASSLIGRHGHVYLVSEDGVPAAFRNTLQQQYPEAAMYVFPHGEQSKNLTTWQQILKDMLEHDLGRKDTVIALGGGVTGDMAGFAAAAYMRGIPYINIPTTSLAMIDSSIGGKTAVDFNGVKNSIGAFWQPDLVLVDPDLLAPLPVRHLHNGLVEAVKEGLTFDPQLFAIFEHDDYLDHIDEIIARCLQIKRDVVEQDEREGGIRKLLNFGHTYGHALESYFGLNGYYHGECVGMGMMMIMNNPELKIRLQAVLERMNCPVSCTYDPEAVYQLLCHDKKADHDHVTIVQVDEIGKDHLEDWPLPKLKERLYHE
ncbi:MAG: 3-dehydroquinate synthase [Erysipelotrichaceae bacterium]|nr:3-dehydroquinate synthase [Erysipelotrichaceae bacterium]